MDRFEQISFLLVDKNLTQLDALASQLQEMGYFNFLEAEDGAEAWAMFQKFHNNFVISQLDLPVINGLSLLKIIRSQSEQSEAPFILVSNQITAKLVMQAGRCGVSDIVVTPFSKEVLKGKILDILEEERLEDRTVEQQYQLGLQLLDKGRYGESLQAFETILNVHQNAEIYFNMGYIKSAQGQYEEALKYFRRATRINNDFARAYKQMAEVYKKLNKLDEASECLNLAGDIYMDRKQDQEAEEIFEMVLKINPETMNVFNSLGIIYRRRNQLDKALEQYHKALRVHPDDENIYFNLGRVYLDMKDFNSADTYLKKALTINPDFGAARELSRAVELGLKL